METVLVQLQKTCLPGFPPFVSTQGHETSLPKKICLCETITKWLEINIAVHKMIKVLYHDCLKLRNNKKDCLIERFRGKLYLAIYLCREK